MIQCHYCYEPFQKIDTANIAKCCIKRCNKYYCIQCIQRHFNPEFDMQMYKKDTWICFNCQKVCDCDKCKHPQKQQRGEKAELGNSDKKGAKRKVGRPRNQADESIQLSISNLSQNNPKIQQTNLSNLQQSQLNIGFNQQDQQSREQQLPDFKFYTQDDMILFPPFYRKIAERRNSFYAFIIKECKKRKHIAKQNKNQQKYEVKQKLCFDNDQK